MISYFILLTVAQITCFHHLITCRPTLDLGPPFCGFQQPDGVPQTLECNRLEIFHEALRIFQKIFMIHTLDYFHLSKKAYQAPQL